MTDSRWTLLDHPERPCRFPSGPLLRTFDDLDDPGGRPDEVLRLSNARIVLLDAALLQHDFPGLEDDDMGPWLLERAAVVSREQTRHLIVNTPIPVAGGPIAAFRPTRYGRSVVCAGGTAGRGADLLDVKGAGIAAGIEPRMTLHGTGLMPLGEALRDATMQWLTEAIFWHARSSFTAVPLYAVIDAGFDVFTLDGRAVPAGLQVRRSHRRPPQSVEQPSPGSLEEHVKGEVEMLLRHYGITSSNPGTWFELYLDGDGRLALRYGGEPMPLREEQLAVIRLLARLPADWNGREIFAGLNVQLAREVSGSPSMAQLVDFGQYSMWNRFGLPVVNLVRGRPALWGGVVHVDDPEFVQPHPDLALPFEQWRDTDPWDIAAACRSGRVGAEQVRRGIEDLIAQTLSKWRRADG